MPCDQCCDATCCEQCAADDCCTGFVTKYVHARRDCTVG